MADPSAIAHTVQTRRRLVASTSLKSAAVPGASGTSRAASIGRAEGLAEVMPRILTTRCAWLIGEKAYVKAYLSGQSVARPAPAMPPPRAIESAVGAYSAGSGHACRRFVRSQPDARRSHGCCVPA